MSADVTPDPDAATTSLSGAGIYKVFGPKPQRALEMAVEGTSRDEIVQSTGNTVAVRDVSFEVSPGETFVVMGLSGSGKSTLVRCIARLIDVSAGRVMLGDRDLTAMSDKELREVRRKNMSMVFQHFGLFPHRRVIENVAYGLEIQGVARDVRREKALEVLEVVGLSGWGDHYPQQLSGGMQQRVGLGRALAVEPEVLFFDEPFSALDPLIRRDMQDELLRLQAEMHRTIMFITHDFDEAIKLGDRIAIMKDGAFDQVGTALELLASPATDYVREFTEDVSRTKVLAACNVMKPQTGERIDTTVGSEQSIDEIMPVLLATTGEIGVLDPLGSMSGVIDRDAVLSVLRVDDDSEIMPAES